MIMKTTNSDLTDLLTNVTDYLPSVKKAWSESPVTTTNLNNGAHEDSLRSGVSLQDIIEKARRISTDARLAEDVTSVTGNLTLFGSVFSTTTLVMIGIGACIIWRIRKKGGPRNTNSPVSVSAPPQIVVTPPAPFQGPYPWMEMQPRPLQTGRTLNLKAIEG